MAHATAARRRLLARRLGGSDFCSCDECGEAIGIVRLRVGPALARFADCTRQPGRR
jgi:RNA polymerase-binding transcription factor DksA